MRAAAAGARGCGDLLEPAARARDIATVHPLQSHWRLPLQGALRDNPNHQTSLTHRAPPQGAPCDAPDRDAAWPLHLAAEGGHEAVVYELLSGPGRRLGVKAKRSDGATPLRE